MISVHEALSAPDPGVRASQNSVAAISEVSPRHGPGVVLTPPAVRPRAGNEALLSRIATFPLVVRGAALAVALAAISAGIAGHRQIALVVIAVLAAHAALAVPTRLRWAFVCSLAIAVIGLLLGLRAAVIASAAIAPLAYAGMRLAPESARLGLNWMDRAIIAQSYAGRPMSTHHVLDVAAPFDRERLVRAVEAFVDSVPTLRSFVRESPLGLARFAAPTRWSCLDTLVTWRDEALDVGASDWYLRVFDLSRQEPFRVLHAPRPGGGYQLVFTLHHSVTDGVGALALFDALLARYAALEGEPLSEPGPIPPSGARLRGLLARRGLRLVASLLRINAQNAQRFGARRASLLEKVDARAAALHCQVREVPAAQWSRLRERAAALGCSRNDVLLAAILRGASAWRREAGLRDEPFRALIPVDLRGEFGAGRSLQNHLGVVEADFDSAEVDDKALEQRVASRVLAERTPERVLATPMAIALLGAIMPPFVYRAFFRWLDERPSAFMYSFLFSHIRVADGFRVPASVGVARLYCLSGLPRQPGIGLTVTALPGHVTVTLAYTPPRLSDEGAKRLLDRFEDAMQSG